MPEQLLDDLEVGTPLQQVSGKFMAHGIGVEILQASFMANCLIFMVIEGPLSLRTFSFGPIFLVKLCSLSARFSERGIRRPCAYLRIEVVDVREALYREGSIILCHDKERTELAPILPETLHLLSQLTSLNLHDHDLIIRSRRV